MTTTTRSRTLQPYVVRILGLVAAVSLVVAAWAGLARAGVLASAPRIVAHGPLMVFGFLGTAIAMERAVGLRRSWGWFAPTASAVGAVLVLAGESGWGACAFAIGGAVLTAEYIAAARLTRYEHHFLVMGLGAVSWVVGAIALTAGAPVFHAVPAMAGFLVLTIAGERVELSRMGPHAHGHQVPWLIVGSAGVVAGATLAAVGSTVGSSVTGAGFVLVGITAWYGDIARRTIRMMGLTRFMAAAILAGYGWLTMSGVVWTVIRLTPGTAAYDVSLHAIFIGFVLSMILAHAAVIVPAVFGVDVVFHPSWWLPLGLLHLSLVLRIVGRYESVALFRLGATLTAVAFGGFVVLAVTSTVWSRRRSPAR